MNYSVPMWFYEVKMVNYDNRKGFYKVPTTNSQLLTMQNRNPMGNYSDPTMNYSVPMWFYEVTMVNYDNRKGFYEVPTTNSQLLTMQNTNWMVHYSGRII